ncbi:hypothetical protein GCE86_09725 [Micromonospora terminaliae]|uniref:Uncharacterized protein n=1 Tax=Micromonospora terminaliae TaxID=1914461 RepID=A0AAJ3DJ58_9ACTN|nr:hypothetical protein [Micromonospora terminaliae]NES27948.1 hypothetical protein [Micromonospora terminaliae]QGL47287.1 hypothetical protein GCE86_09725 [Micromonospora terminaliae]
MTSEAVGTGRRGGPIVGFLFLLWVCGLITAAVWWVGIGLEQWSVSYGDQPGEFEDLRRRANVAVLVAALVATAGPALIALVAYQLRLVRTAVVFLVLAVVIAVPAVPFALLAGRDLDPAPAVTTPGPPGHCVEHSGGDTRCPGG